MNITEFNGTKICLLDDSDKATDCPCGSYAVIEDSGFDIVVLVMGDDFWAIHSDPVFTLEDALYHIYKHLNLS